MNENETLSDLCMAHGSRCRSYIFSSGMMVLQSSKICTKERQPKPPPRVWPTAPFTHAAPPQTGRFAGRTGPCGPRAP